MTSVQLPQPVQACLVGLDSPGPGVQRPHDAGEQVDRRAALHRDQFRERGIDPGAYLRLAKAQATGERGYFRAERRTVGDLLGDQPRHLVSVPGQAPLGALQRHHGRAPYVARERLGICGRA